MSEAIVESQFANNFAEAQQPGGTTGYVRALLDLLGDRDPLTVVEATPAALELTVVGLDDERLRRPEKPGKWSIAEVVAHLADSELVWGYRLRRVLADDRPRITGYDQDAWAARLRYRDAALADSLALFKALRPANLRLVRAAT
ncbi:MAG TPA: DinB family protein, partial [Thermoanaerobaculia bacterium]|nr:DinB family protein [Thermoanaerobaculia bacterium]